MTQLILTLFAIVIMFLICQVCWRIKNTVVDLLNGSNLNEMDKDE